MSNPEKTPLMPDDDSGKPLYTGKSESKLWNELGNLYFSSGAYDIAIESYNKAIESDSQFGLPYSNLALTYVQKGYFAEAILLYQRSIELLISDKDKAITWNRLGDVYRNLNDYSKATAAYQEAGKLSNNDSLEEGNVYRQINDYSSPTASSQKPDESPSNNPSKEGLKSILKTDSFLQETLSGLRMFFKWTISSFMDGVFVALWALIQYSFNQVIQYFPLQGVDVWVFRCFQFLFAITTVAPVVIYIYEDIMIMSYRTAKRVRFEKEQNHISE